MEFIKLMKFKSELTGNTENPVGLWKSDKNVCEFSEGQDGNCDNSGLFYGTDDEREPKFCARHFYQLVVSGDGKSNYKLVDIGVL